MAYSEVDEQAEYELTPPQSRGKSRGHSASGLEEMPSAIAESYPVQYADVPPRSSHSNRSAPRAELRPRTASSLRSVKSVHEARELASQRRPHTAGTPASRPRSRHSQQAPHDVLHKPPSRGGAGYTSIESVVDSYEEGPRSWADPILRSSQRQRTHPVLTPDGSVNMPPLRNSFPAFVKFGPPQDPLFQLSRRLPPGAAYTRVRLINEPPLAGYSRGIGMWCVEADQGRLSGGVVVSKLRRHDRAWEAGLRVGDVIIGLDHSTVHNREQLRTRLEMCNPVTTFVIRRGADTLRLRMRR
eukprot:Rmarinus@m.6104